MTRAMISAVACLAFYMAATAWLFPNLWTPSLTRAESFIERAVFLCSGIYWYARRDI